MFKNNKRNAKHVLTWLRRVREARQGLVDAKAIRDVVKENDKVLDSATRYVNSCDMSGSDFEYQILMESRKLEWDLEIADKNVYEHEGKLALCEDTLALTIDTLLRRLEK